MEQAKRRPRRTADVKERVPSVRVSVNLTTLELEQIKVKANAVGLTLSRYMADSALSDWSNRPMSPERVIEHQQQIIRDIQYDCDVWIFGGGGPALPFTERADLGIEELWLERADKGVIHRVFWDLDLADADRLENFVHRTTRIARKIQKNSRPSIIHYGVVHGSFVPRAVSRFEDMKREVESDESLLRSIAIVTPISLVKAEKPVWEVARWLCRFGAMGSLICVAPRRLGEDASACLLHDGLTLQPSARSMEIWEWFSKPEAQKLARYAGDFLRLMPPPGTTQT